MGRPGCMVRRRPCDRSLDLGRDTQVSNRRRCMSSINRLLALVLIAAVPAVARAAVDCTAREPLLRHVCDKGQNAGLECTPDFSNIDTLTCSVSRPAVKDPGGNDPCLGAKCTMVFEKGATFSAVMTMIVDNNVSALDAPQTIQNAIALTVIIDLGKRGVLSQTYQNLTGTELSDLTSPPRDDFGVAIDEQRLETEPELRPDGKAAIVNDLLFRPQDPELADALRAIFNGTGKSVVTKVSSVDLTDHQTDGLATVLRLKVKGAFVAVAN